MIIYVTKQTRERYKIKLPHEKTPPDDFYTRMLILKESGDEILEWGCKLFYFDGRKCVQLVNFASKFTLFLCDIKVVDMKTLGDRMANYLLEMYKDDTEMYNCIVKMLKESPLFCFDKLTNKSIISTLNKNQLDFAWDGYRFYDYIDNGILRTLQINHDVNYDWLVTKDINGKKEYVFPGELFRKLMIQRYGEFETGIVSKLPNYIS